MKITRIRIRDYRSIKTLDVTVPPNGFGIVGPNEIGKSNIIRALRATLTGQGVSPDAIRDGADDCEVLIDTDHPTFATIRQTITPDGGRLTVKNADGDKPGRPRERLKEMVPLSCFDALAFYRASPAEQRKMILAASPVTLTDEDVARWTGGERLGFDLTRNGLEVLAALHKHYYDLRTAANTTAKDAAAAAKLKSDEADGMQSNAHKGVLVPPAGQEGAPVVAAEKAREALEQRRQQAEAMARRTEGTRARIAELRREADVEDARGFAPVNHDFYNEAADAMRAATANVIRLRQELEAAEKEERERAEMMDRLEQQQRAHGQSDARSRDWRRQADQLEATLAEAAVEPPTVEELAAADAAIAQARAHAALVRSARAAHDATVAASVLAAEAKTAKEEAERLDRIVRTLAVDAPIELAARANLIPGLSLTEDGVLYKGRPLDDSMSGAQRMLVAVEIAKRANAKAGLLMVDEIGVLDDEHMREFVRLCTADDWQLFSTCMRNIVGEDGKPTREMVLEAYELDEDDKPLNPARRVKVVKDGKEIA